MSEVTVTVLSGVLVLVLGQVLQKFFLEPILEQKRLIGEIAFALTYYANISPSREQEEIIKAHTELRTLASKLRSTMWTIPLYVPLSFFRILHRKWRIQQASQGLIGWSNTLWREGSGRDEQITLIRDALNIPERF
jgi:hypothetical protein